MTVEIKLSVDLSNEDQVNETLAFLKKFSSDTEEEQPKKPAAKKTPSKSAPKKAAAKKDEPKEEAEENESSVTMDDLRSLVVQKGKTHKPAIKKKLTELGAENVPTLDESKYEEFKDFLEDLD